MGLFGSTENCNSSSSTMVNHVQIPKQQKKNNNFIERKRNISRVHGFSLADSLPGMKKSLSSS